MPVKPVTKEQTKKDILKANDIEDDGRGYVDSTLVNISDINSAMDSWAALQTGERDERILELEAGLKPFAEFASHVFKDGRNNGETGILFGYDKGNLLYSDLRTVTQLLNPTGINEKK